MIALRCIPDFCDVRQSLVQSAGNVKATLQRFQDGWNPVRCNRTAAVVHADDQGFCTLLFSLGERQARHAEGHRAFGQRNFADAKLRAPVDDAFCDFKRENFLGIGKKEKVRRLHCHIYLSRRYHGMNLIY